MTFNKCQGERVALIGASPLLFRNTKNTEDKVCFENCRFENNTSSSEGGAVYIADSATGTFSDCIFGNAEDETLGNYCTDTMGGGGAVYATGASITLSNCEFYYNKATGDFGNGGAIGADSFKRVCTAFRERR